MAYDQTIKALAERSVLLLNQEDIAGLIDDDKVDLAELVAPMGHFCHMTAMEDGVVIRQILAKAA